LQSSTASAQNAAAGSSIASAGQWITFNLSVPIAGWSSGTVIPSDLDSRVVAAYATTKVPSETIVGSIPASVLTNAWSDVYFPTVDYDTHGGFTNGVYIVKTPGIYDCTGILNVATTVSATAGQYVAVGIKRLRNGAATIFHQTWLTTHTTGSGYNYMVTTNGIVEAQAGDQLSIASWTNVTGGADWAGGLGGNSFSFRKLNGPSQAPASESVTARASGSTSAGQSIATATVTPMVYGGVVRANSHAALTAATGVFVCPVSGRYRVSTAVLTAAGGGWAAGEYLLVAIRKGGTDQAVSYNVSQTTHTQAVGTTLSDQVDCLAGESIDVTVYQNSGATLALSTSANSNYVAIERVGNQ
jgi:hypothetical protein